MKPLFYVFTVEHLISSSKEKIKNKNTFPPNLHILVTGNNIYLAVQAQNIRDVSSRNSHT